MDNSNINDNENNSEITPEVDKPESPNNNENNSEITPKDNKNPNHSPESQNNNEETPKLGNGYNPASSNREAFQRGLDTSYNDRIARNKANVAQARARSNEITKKNEDGEQQDKNFIDKTKDKANLLKAKKSLLSSQIDSARSKAFQLMHPVEAAKMVAKKKLKTLLISLVISAWPLFLIFLIILGVAANDYSGGSGSSDGSSSIHSGVKESGFTISATSLSKEEYKSKLVEFSKTNPNFQIFADNAYDIYEYCLSKNVNPELVAVRAYVEGAGKTTGTYNYWGMGCANEGGLQACFNYSSFEEGYTDFVNNISQYNSLADMMSKYAYIGKYWYNPGDSGTGGCYYAPYIYTPENMPIRVSNACSSSAPACSVGNKANCVETTDEDQTAYANWQVEKNMADARLKIFGLAYNEGPTTYTPGDYKHLSTYTLSHEGLNVLNRTLNQSEIIDLNNYINSEVDNAGYGTGAAVAAAGQSLTYWLEQKGYYLQYYWGGGHGGYGDKKDTFIGANPNWGSTAFGKDEKGRQYLGFDCSGFVSWAIRTACNPKYGSTTTNFKRGGKDHEREINIKDAKPGDLMITDGHIRLVVKNNNDGSVIVAESAGGETSGLVFTKRKDDSSYYFMDMENYYGSHCKTSR